MQTAALSFASRLKFRVRPIRVAEFSFLIFLALAMGLPLLFLLIGSFNLAAPGKAAVYASANWTRAFSDPGTVSALWMSFLLSVVRLIPAMVISVLFAWLIARTDMPGGKFIEAICWIAYFIPDFPLVLAWILLLDANFGFLNTLATNLPFVDGPVFNPYSFWGIVWVHTSTGGIWFKVMLLAPVFRRLGATLEEAARRRRNTVQRCSGVHAAGAGADDSGGRGAELHPRSASFNTGALLGTPAVSTLFDENLRLSAARATRLRRGDGLRLGVLGGACGAAVFLLAIPAW
jgi:ABC-type spermidine/putrescine transport system permease subunit II